MPATAAWLASAEALLNRSIDASAQAAALAQRLQGTSLQVEVDGLIRIRASTHQGRLSLCAGEDCAADASIEGSLPALLQLFRDGANRQSGGPAAQIRGDAEIANRYRELFMLARPDPEEELSRWIGDFPARRVSEAAKRALAFARRAPPHGRGKHRRVPAGGGPRPREQDRAGGVPAGVDELRDTADRIEARLGRLEARLKGAA